MKNKHYLTVLILILPIISFSQITITGRVVDVENRPLELVEIILLSKDSIALKSELTDLSGNFMLNEKGGHYLLQVRQVGKILYHKLLVLEKKADLGIIRVESFQGLQEVIVTSKKKLIERKVDRLVFNVENSVAATGGDAIDVLKVTPGLRVQNDAISMIGKSGMAVMVDDRLMQLSGDDLINFLKSIQSDNIKSIEVITNPPAKYSAEGNSGLVNIKLLKAKEDSWNAAINTAYRQATYSIGSAGFSFNYQKSKISFLSNINFVDGSMTPIETSRIYYPNQLWENANNRRDFFNNKGGRIGLNYQATKKWTIGVQYMGRFSKPNIEENNLTTIIDNASNLINSFIKTEAKNLRERESHSYNWHTIYKVDTVGTKVSVDFDYFKYNGSDDRIFKSNKLNSSSIIIPNSYFSVNNDNKNSLTNYAGKIDVEIPLKWMNISFGGKFSFSKNNNNAAFYNLTNVNPIFDPNQSNQFKYNENIGALYFSGTKKISAKWEIQAGLRMETTHTEGVSITLNETNNNKYTKFFPTVYISYTPNDNRIFTLNYSKRINRPPYFSLNPFRWYSNPYSYSEGNPFLQPSYSHNIEFSFTKNQNWESKIYYSTIENGFFQLTSIDAVTTTEATKYTNYFNTEIVGLSESFTFNLSKFWESVNSLTLSYSNSTSKVSFTNQNRVGFNSYFSTNNTFNLNTRKTMIFNFNFWLNPKGVSDLDKNTAFNQLDVSLKFFFLNKNLQLSITGNDVLSSNRPTYSYYSNNIKQVYKNYYDYQSFRISLTYKFGNNNISVKKRDFGNEEEKSRTN